MNPSPDSLQTEALERLHEHPVLAADILQGLQVLEADAGTGKTWTLSGLVLRGLLELQLEIGEILVVTFTRAATAELRDRIRARIRTLARWLQARVHGGPVPVLEDPFLQAWAPSLPNPAAALLALRQAEQDLDGAPIDTIHAFCQRVLTEHSLVTNTPLEVEFTQDTAALRRRIVRNWWQEHIGQDIRRVCALRAERITIERLDSHLASLLAAPDLVPRPLADDWRVRLVQREEAIAALAQAWPQHAADLLAWMLVQGNVHGGMHRKALLPWRFEAIGRWLQAPAGEPVPEKLFSLTPDGLAKGHAQPREVPGPLPDLCRAVQRCDAPLGALLPMLLDELRQHAEPALRRLKEESGQLDFQDLLLRTREALAEPATGPALAARLRRRHPLALIDEFQDTDATQWAIFRSVWVTDPPAPRGGLVLVGDPKQSIYGFRGADVETYLEARELAVRVHRLDANQRSDAALLAGVNHLFARDDAFKLPRIRFQASRFGERSRSSFAPERVSPRAPLCWVHLAGGVDAQGKPTTLTKEDAGPRADCACAAEIVRLLGPDGPRLDGEAVVPADIVALVNSHHDAARLKAELARHGIGAVELGKESVFASPQALDLLRVLLAVSEPGDSTRLRGALATRLCGQTVAQLRQLEHDAHALEDAVSCFALAGQRWAQAGVHAALRPLLQSFGGLARVAEALDGERVLTNTFHLLDLIAEDPQARVSAARAAHWLDARRADPPDADSAQLRLESDERLVRISTVHASKGLEYPIVFLHTAWSARRTPSAATPKSPLRWHDLTRRPGEPGARILDFGMPQAPDGSEPLSLARDEALAEALRGLYVALTRARHRCYVFWGEINQADATPLDWLLRGARSRGDLERFLEPLGTRTEVLDDQALVAATPGSLPTGSGADALIPPAGVPVQPFDTRIPAPWLVRSFSALLRSSENAPVAALTERPDHDAALPPSEPPTGPVEAPTSDPGIRFRFEASASAGECLHALLEHADFSAPLDRAAAEATLQQHGFDPADAPEVVAWLEEVLDTPLPVAGGARLRLCELARRDTLRELGFDLAAPQADARALARSLMSAPGWPMPDVLPDTRWQGFLRGFIDLVYRHDGRYYVLDWKSNRLGGRLTDYTDEAIRRSMSDHAYALQAAIYLLALHRHLQRSLPGYDPRAHLGGVQYLYLRGVHPAAHAAGRGVWWGEASLPLLQALEQALGGALPSGDRLS